MQSPKQITVILFSTQNGADFIIILESKELIVSSPRRESLDRKWEGSRACKNSGSVSPIEDRALRKRERE